MRGQNQSAGDNSALNQAAGDIHNNTTNNNTTHQIVMVDAGGVDRYDAMKIAEEVLERRLPALTAEARRQFESRAEELTKRVVEDVIAADPLLLDRLREPRIQIALGTAQSGYGETGDQELRNILARLVVGTVRQEARSHKDLVFRQCIETAPKLTTR